MHGKVHKPTDRVTPPDPKYAPRELKRRRRLPRPSIHDPAALQSVQRFPDKVPLRPLSSRPQMESGQSKGADGNFRRRYVSSFPKKWERASHEPVSRSKSPAIVWKVLHDDDIEERNVIHDDTDAPRLLEQFTLLSGRTVATEFALLFYSRSV